MIVPVFGPLKKGVWKEYKSGVLFGGIPGFQK